MIVLKESNVINNQITQYKNEIQLIQFYNKEFNEKIRNKVKDILNEVYFNYFDEKYGEFDEGIYNQDFIAIVPLDVYNTIKDKFNSDLKQKLINSKLVRKDFIIIDLETKAGYNEIRNLSEGYSFLKVRIEYDDHGCFSLLPQEYRRYNFKIRYISKGSNGRGKNLYFTAESPKALFNYLMEEYNDYKITESLDINDYYKLFKQLYDKNGYGVVLIQNLTITVTGNLTFRKVLFDVNWKRNF